MWDADADYSKLLGGCSQIIGGIYPPYPPHPPLFRHPRLYASDIALQCMYIFSLMHTFNSMYVYLIQCMYSIQYICNASEVESRTQGSRPRTQKKSEAKAKDSLSEDRHSRGQGQECSRPRPRTKDTSASALQKKKKKVFTKIFQAISTKRRFLKNFSTAPQNFNNSKNTAVLEPRTGQFSRT